MKKSIILISILLFTTCLQAQLIFEEGFEGPFENTDWSAKDENLNSLLTTTEAISTVLSKEGYSSLKAHIIFTPFFQKGAQAYFLFRWMRQNPDTDNYIHYIHSGVKKYNASTNTHSDALTSSQIPIVSLTYGENWYFNELVIPPSITASWNEYLYVYSRDYTHNISTNQPSGYKTMLMDKVRLSSQSLQDYNDSVNNILAGVNDYFDKTFKVYSSESQLKIVSAINQENISISVFDITGKTILNKSEDLIKNQNITLRTEGLSKGIYIVSVSDGKNRFSEKIIIQ